MTITATWYEPTKGYNLVEVDIDLFAMPAATAELIEKIRIAKSSRAGCEIRPEEVVYEALTDFAAKNAWLAGMHDDRIKAETEAKEVAEKKRAEDEKVEQVFGGMVL